MKNYLKLFVLFIILFPVILASCVQRDKSRGAGEVFGSYEGEQGVITFRLPPAIFSMIIGKEEPALRETLKQLDQVKVLLMDRSAADRNDPEAAFLRKLAELGFEDLMVVTESGNRVRIAIYQEEEDIQEVMILVTSEDAFLGLSLVGNIREQDLMEIASRIRTEDFAGNW